MEIRPATHEDADEGSAVLRRSIEELCYADHGGDPQALAEWIANKTPAMWRAWVGQDGVRLYVAVEDRQILGVGMVTADGEIRLNYVSPEARFRGVSKALLARMETDARALGATGCRLESTRTAHPFYQAAGYRSRGDGGAADSGMSKSFGPGCAH